MNTPRRVEFALDLICVFTYLGYTRLLRAVERYRAEGGEVDVVFLPVQLRPRASVEGEPLFEVHKRDFGEATAREIAADRSFGAEDGLDVHFSQAWFVGTFDAHRLLAQAAAQGRGERMAERLFRAYFTDGLNIADGPTLARLAAEIGVVPGEGDAGADELHAELARVRALDLAAPPVFRFQGGPHLTGEQTVADLLTALRQSQP